MLKRKIEAVIKDHFESNDNRILLIDGARQVGKSYIIRHVGQEYFKNYIEINLVEDFENKHMFSNVSSVDDFYLSLSLVAGNKLGKKEDTLIFLDEIQVYPKLLTLLKFLREDNRFTYICSGSLLGVSLAKTTSIPTRSTKTLRMYPLDFEEFLYANGLNDFAINSLKNKFLKLESLDEAIHNKIMDLFKKYLLVGGLPEAVNIYLDTLNIVKVREYQKEVHDNYKLDASKYDREHKFEIERIYDMVPSNMENKKKRLVVKDIENIKGKTFKDYQNEFEYLISSGICLETKAISTPTFPLIESSSKNLLKLYLSDVGILTSILYKNNDQAILQDVRSINLGAVYETVVASELASHGYNLFYYDNRKNGEVDYLIDDYDSLSVLPIIVKSGRDYTIHSALNKFLSNEDYNVKKAYVVSNNREVVVKNKIIYIPIYYIMFFNNN